MQTSFLHSHRHLFPVSIPPPPTISSSFSLPANRRLDGTFRQIDFCQPFNRSLFAPHECPKRYFPDTEFPLSLFPDIYSRSYTSRTDIRCRPALFKPRTPLKEASNTNPIQGSFPNIREHPNHNTTFRHRNKTGPVHKPSNALTEQKRSNRQRSYLSRIQLSLFLGKPTPSMCVDAPKFPIAPFDSDSKDRFAATIRVYPSPFTSAESVRHSSKSRATKVRTLGYNRDKNRTVRKHAYRKSGDDTHI